MSAILKLFNIASWMSLGIIGIVRIVITELGLSDITTNLRGYFTMTSRKNKFMMTIYIDGHLTRTIANGTKVKMGSFSCGQFIDCIIYNIEEDGKMSFLTDHSMVMTDPGFYLFTLSSGGEFFHKRVIDY